MPKRLWRPLVDNLPAEWLSFAAHAPYALMLERALLRDFEASVQADRVPSRFDTSRDLPVVRARRALYHETANRLPRLAVEFAAAEGGGATVAEIADCFVTSFERSIAVVAADVNNGRWARFFLRAVDSRLKIMGQLAPVLRNVAHPEVTLVHRAMLYRCLAATWLDEWVARPLALSGLSYALHLYTETHMAWLGAAVRHNVVEDGDWLRPAARARLASYYPLPNRAVCFEELPDMAALLMRWNVMGTPQQNKKKRRCIQVWTALYPSVLAFDRCPLLPAGPGPPFPRETAAPDLPRAPHCRPAEEEGRDDARGGDPLPHAHPHRTVRQLRECHVACPARAPPAHPLGLCRGRDWRARLRPCDNGRGVVRLGRGEQAAQAGGALPPTRTLYQCVRSRGRAGHDAQRQPHQVVRL